MLKNTRAVIFVIILMVIFTGVFFAPPLFPVRAATVTKVYFGDAHTVGGRGHWNLYGTDADHTSFFTVREPANTDDGMFYNLAADNARQKLYFEEDSPNTLQTIWQTDLDGSNAVQWMDYANPATDPLHVLIADCVEVTAIAADNDFIAVSRKDKENNHTAAFYLGGAFYRVISSSGIIESMSFNSRPFEPDHTLYFYQTAQDGLVKGIYISMYTQGAPILIYAAPRAIVTLAVDRGYIFISEYDAEHNFCRLIRLDMNGENGTPVEMYRTQPGRYICSMAVSTMEDRLYFDDCARDNFSVSPSGDVYKGSARTGGEIRSIPLDGGESSFWANYSVLNLAIANYTPAECGLSNWGAGGGTVENHSITPSDGNHTDFGNLPVTRSRVYEYIISKIPNSLPLNFINPAPYVTITGNTSDFSLTLAPPTPYIDSGGSIFDITFHPTGPGVTTANVSFSTNNPNAQPFWFIVKGRGVAKPIIYDLNGDSATFLERGPPVYLDTGSNAVINEGDIFGYAGGNVSLVYSGGSSGSDSLRVDGANVLSGTDAVIAGGEDIKVDGVTIGSVNAVNNGQNGAGLVITLNASANDTRLNMLLRNILFTNGSVDPLGTRTINITVAPVGAISDIMTVTVTLLGINDPPTLAATGQNASYTENHAAVDLFSGVVLTAPEPSQMITELKLTASNVSEGAGEILGIDGSDVALNNGNSVSTINHGMTASVSLTGTTATVTIAKAAGISGANAQALVDGITYRTTGNNPGADTRFVTLTSTKDNGGTARGGVDNTVLSISARIIITPVNDPPVIADLDNDTVSVAVIYGRVNIDLGGNAVVADADSPDFNNGLFYIMQTAGTANYSFGVDGTNVLSGSDAVITAGEDIYVSNVSIGTVTGDGQGASDFSIALNANATPARVTTLIRNISFTAPSGLGARTYELLVFDGDGSDHGGQDNGSVLFHINVTPNPPVIANLNGDAVTHDPFIGSATLIDTGNNSLVTDLDSANFSGGNLRVTITAGNMSTEDLLGISGSANVSISGTTAGSNVNVDGVAIGTLALNIDNGNDLMITFNANATPARVDKLLRAIIYTNTNNVNPSLAVRTVRVTITDAGVSAATSAPVYVTVNISSREINLKCGANIPDGCVCELGNCYAGSALGYIFTIENNGGSVLHITLPIIIGGNNADQFTVTAPPAATVTGYGITTFIIMFAPDTSGVKTAALTIINDDIDENHYTITLQGNGVEPPVLMAPATPTTTPPAKDEPVVETGEEVEVETNEEGEVQNTITLVSEDGDFSLQISQNTTAFDNEGKPLTTITAVPMENPPPPPSSANIVGLTYDLGPNGATFNPAIVLTFKYNDADIPDGVNEADLKLAYYNEETGEWVEVESVVDTVNNIIMAYVTHFTDFTIIGQETRLPLFSTNDLTITKANVGIELTFNISVSAINSGNAAGSYSVVLKVNGEVYSTANVTLGTNETKTVSFTLSGLTAGIYNIDVNGLTEIVRIDAIPTTTKPVTPTTKPAAPTTVTIAPTSTITPLTITITTQVITPSPSLTSTFTTVVPTMTDNGTKQTGWSWWTIALLGVGGTLVLVLGIWRFINRRD